MPTVAPVATDLPYGAGTLPLAGCFPDAEWVTPQGAAAAPLAADALRVIVERLAADLAAAAGPNGRILLSIPDTTRYAAAEVILPPLLAALARGGADPARVEARFALGIHRTLTRAEQEGILGADAALRLRFADHAANGPFDRLGVTRRGTPIEVNPAVCNADAVLLLGAASFHYFAGFGGGRKLLVPGLSTARACRANHLLVLRTDGPGRHPGVGPGKLAGNPVHEDMMDALAEVERRTRVFTLTLLFDPKKRPLAAHAGDARAAFEGACRDHAERFSRRVAERRPVVLVSCGGAPKDINFIQAHKTLEYAMAALTPGGTMIVLAECPQGYGHAEFAGWFAHGPASAMEEALRLDYQIYGQTAWATRWKAEQADILLVSALPEADVVRMGLRPVRSLPEAEAFVRGKHGGRPPAFVIPYGAMTLPVVAAG
ncbi:MAG: nickel-dependent lactate racemase [Planctomycetes bacterium]|nr:nickel-dependent lactate racemase [Planctomycetota bacterium]